MEQEELKAADFELFESLKSDEAIEALGQEACNSLSALVMQSAANRRVVLQERLKSDEEQAGLKHSLLGFRRRAEVAESELADLRGKAGELERRYLAALETVRNAKAKLAAAGH